MTGINLTFDSYCNITIGVVLKDIAEADYVHSLLYRITADFNKSDFEEYLGKKLEKDELYFEENIFLIYML